MPRPQVKSAGSTMNLSERYKRTLLERMEAKADLGDAYTRERVKQVATRRKADELLLAKARDDVIEKRLVEKQAAYLLVSLRQKILSLPQGYARKILGLTDVNQASRLLKEMSLSVLNEIKDLPQKVVDPRWLEDLEEDQDAADRI